MPPSTQLAKAQAQTSMARASANQRIAGIKAKVEGRISKANATIKAIRESFTTKLVLGFGSAALGSVIGGQIRRRDPMGYGSQLNVIGGLLGGVMLYRARGNNGKIVVGGMLLGLLIGEVFAWASEQDWFDDWGKEKTAEADPDAEGE